MSKTRTDDSGDPEIETAPGSDQEDSTDSAPVPAAPDFDPTDPDAVPPPITPESTKEQKRARLAYESSLNARIAHAQAEVATALAEGREVTVDYPDVPADDERDTSHDAEKLESGEYVDSDDLTKADLQARAAELDIKGRSSMSKEELGEAIAKAEDEQEGDGDS